MRPEEVIEKTICEEARQHGWRVFKLTFIGVNGAPDRWFGKAGRNVLIEFKAPGEEPTEQQRKRHRELREDFGVRVDMCDDVRQGRTLLGLPGG